MRNKGGRPPKAKGGLGHVIYVRATEQMVRALDARADALSAETGLSVSRSDAARKIIADSLGIDRIERASAKGSALKPKRGVMTIP